MGCSYQPAALDKLVDLTRGVSIQGFLIFIVMIMTIFAMLDVLLFADMNRLYKVNKLLSERERETMTFPRYLASRHYTPHNMQDTVYLLYR